MAAHLSMPLQLRDGTRLYLRPLRSTDRDRYVAEVSRMSPESRYERFLSAIDHVTDDMVTQLVDDVDGVNHVAIVLFTEEGDEPIALGRFIRDRHHPDRAEVAFAVRDDRHGQGAGSLIADGLKSLALERDIRYFTATVLRRNQGSLRLMARFGAVDEVTEIDSGVVEILVDLYGEPYSVTQGTLDGFVGASRHHPDESPLEDTGEQQQVDLATLTVSTAARQGEGDAPEAAGPDLDETTEMRSSRGRLLGWLDGFADESGEQDRDQPG